MESPAYFACGHGHKMAMWVDGKSVDMTGYFCPACLGHIIGHENLIDCRILAPVQIEDHAATER